MLVFLLVPVNVEDTAREPSDSLNNRARHASSPLALCPVSFIPDSITFLCQVMLFSFWDGKEVEVGTVWGGEWGRELSSA